MKRFYLYVVLSLFSFKYYGQTILTNGLVYNYSVGDTIKHYTQVNAGPPISYTTTYTQKTVKVDTIIYQVQQQYYQPASCMTCSVSAGINTYSYQVTDLNANAIHFVLTNTVCTTQYDSLYTNGCGQMVNLRQNNWGPTCFEPDMYKSYLIEGVGLFYEYSYGQDPNHYQNSKTLTYYHKVGQAPCGGNGMPLGINNNNIFNIISIYPNPVISEKIVISKNNASKTVISIFSIEGKLVYQSESNSEFIEINENFESGIYFLKLQDSTGETLVKKIIIE